ncbi:MAG: hypothetical protein JXQ82_04890 [Methanomicrobiaceae archaeon]|nr:hypothetical protein [Methanomicrobiaceae archaeon]
MTDYYAFSSIDTAIDKTKLLLWPFNRSIWLRIALISLFLGGFSSFNPFQFKTGPQDMPFSAFGSEVFLNELPLFLIIVAIIILIALIFTYISNVFQFLFVDCLSKKEFAIRKYFRENMGRGARLFGFEILIGLLFSAILAVIIVLMFGGITDTFTAPNFGFIISMFLAIFLLCIPFGIILLFTIDFVVPIMLKEQCGVLEGWKKCWKVLQKDLWQTIIYLIMRIILAIVTSILMLIVIMIAALILAIPFFIAGLIAVGLLGEGVFGTALIILIIIYLICLIPIALIISVPFITFLKHYTLDVLGNMEEKYIMLQ